MGRRREAWAYREHEIAMTIGISSENIGGGKNCLVYAQVVDQTLEAPF